MSEQAFKFRAVDAGGGRQTGVARAPDKIEAFRKITAQGLTPISIRPVRAARVGARGRIRASHVAQFTYELSVLIGARITISDGLLSIAEQEPNERFKSIILDIAGRIESGQQIAESIGAHERVFGPVYIETVRAAEKTGNTIKVLEHLSQMLERQQEMASQVRGAFMYPIVVSTALVVGVSFLLGFVVPKFGAMFAERGVPLPVPTRALIAVGHSVHMFWWIYGLVIFGTVIGVRRAWRTTVGRNTIDALMHRVPLLRKILVASAIARFTRVLGLSVSSGVGLIEAIEMAGRASGRPMLQRDARRMVEQVRSGGRLRDALATCTYLTPLARRMIGAGEEAAELSQMCETAARHHEHQAKALAKNIGTVIEPVLVVAIAAVVLMIALAIFLPMWNMMSLLE